MSFWNKEKISNKNFPTKKIKNFALKIQFPYLFTVHKIRMIQKYHINSQKGKKKSHRFSTGDDFFFFGRKGKLLQEFSVWRGLTRWAWVSSQKREKTLKILQKCRHFFALRKAVQIVNSIWNFVVHQRQITIISLPHIIMVTIMNWRFNDTAKSITPEIIQKSTEIMSTTSDTPTITRIINKYSGLNFDWRTIYYQTNKLKENQFGKRSHNLIKMLQKDVELRGGYYKAEQGSNQELLIVCYMTERMKRIVSTFNDLVIIDGSHGANRFNMQLVDVVVITNLGKTSACFFALLLNQKYESFLWAMKNLKTQLRDQPIVIFSDEEEALVKANFFIHSFFE